MAGHHAELFRVRRPFLVIGFSFIFVLTFISFCSNLVKVLILTLFLFLSIFFGTIKKESTFLLTFLSCFSAICIYFINLLFKEIPLNAIYGKDLSISGIVVEDFLNASEKFHYTVKINHIDGMDHLPRFKMELITKNPLEVELGDELTASVHVLEKTSSVNRRSNEIYSVGYVYSYKDIFIIKNHNFFQPFKHISKFRNCLIEKIRQTFSPKAANFICAVWLARKHDINQDIRESFASLGISHLLAVSGTHISILAQSCYIFLRFLKINRVVSNSLTAFCVFIFVCLTGFAPSATRAGIMVIIYLISKSIFREYDALNSLGISIFLILLISPNSCFSIGLWLSSLSVLGIITFSKKIECFLTKILGNKNKFINFLISNISISISATLFTLPLIAIIFKRMSLIFILINAFASLLLEIFINLIIISLFFKSLMNITFWPKLTDLIVNKIILLAEKTENIPFISLNLEYKYIPLWISFNLMLFSFYLFFDENHKFRLKISCISYIMLTSATISSQNYERNKIRIAILHKTGERSMVISKGKKAVVLPFDGNRSKNLSYLRSLNYPELLVIGSKSDTFYNYKNQNITYLFPGNEDFIFQNENIKLFIFQNNGKRFLKLSIGNTNLVAFPDGGNVKFLPDILKSPEISILFYIPQNFDLIKSKYSILANNSYFSKINSEKLKRLNVIDGTNCDIIIDVDVKSNKNIIGRRI